MSRAVLLATLLLCACGGGGPLPAPEILSVTPNQVSVSRGAPAAERKSVRISLDAVIPVRVDYGREQVRTDAARVWIGPEEAPLEGLEQDGTLTVAVPKALDPGTYDVRVALSDGRETARSSALTLLLMGGTRTDTDAGVGEPPEELTDAGPLILVDGGVPLDAGTPRDGGVKLPDEPGPHDPIRPGDVTGFELEPVEPQRQGVAFLVTVRALGPRAAHFQDSVELSINKNNGGVRPTKLGPFDNGMCTQLVTVDAQGGNVKLTVTDAYGAQGTSNGFKVSK